MRFTRSPGMILLGIWLLLTGLAGLVRLGIPPNVPGALAVAAGVLILVGR